MSQNKSNRYPNTRNKRKSTWLPVLLVGGGILLIGAAFFALRPRAASSAYIEVSGAPSLKVDQEKVDLGDVKFNQLAEVSFQLTNVGDQELRFTKEPYIEVVEGC